VTKAEARQAIGVAEAGLPNNGTENASTTPVVVPVDVVSKLDEPPEVVDDNKNTTAVTAKDDEEVDSVKQALTGDAKISEKPAEKSTTKAASAPNDTKRNDKGGEILKLREN
jgi:hypothetical protein